MTIEETIAANPGAIILELEDISSRKLRYWLDYGCGGRRYCEPPSDAFKRGYKKVYRRKMGRAVV